MEEREPELSSVRAKANETPSLGKNGLPFAISILREYLVMDGVFWSEVHIGDFDGVVSRVVVFDIACKVGWETRQ